MCFGKGENNKLPIKGMGLNSQSAFPILIEEHPKKKNFLQNI
jgi:hypothetical protein